MMLGDMGADVMKIEPSGAGDDTRAWGPYREARKPRILSAQPQQELAHAQHGGTRRADDVADLIATADVLIDNFRLGTLEKWGFTDAWFEAAAPRLIRCSITGYGSSGPKAALPGYDFVLQAELGLMSICGEPDGVPTKYGVAIVDVCTGMLAGNAILAALNARPHTGKGQKVELSLYESSLFMLVNVASNYLMAGRDGGRFGNGHPSIVPYTTYQAADAMMAIVVGNERQFANCAEVSAIPNGRPDARSASTVHGGRTGDHRRADLCGALAREGRSTGSPGQGGGRAVREDQLVAEALDRPAHPPRARMVETVEHPAIGAPRCWRAVQVLRPGMTAAAGAAEAGGAQRGDSGDGAGRRDEVLRSCGATGWFRVDQAAVSATTCALRRLKSIVKSRRKIRGKLGQGLVDLLFRRIAEL